MEIKKCTAADVSELAILNLQLVEDEQCDKKRLSIKEMEERMSGWLAGDYDAYFFIADLSVVGYALVDRTKEPFYLKHFMIKREYRRMSYGRNALQLLIDYLGTEQLDIEVYSWNKRGIAFWESCGFKERCKYMRYQR